MHSLYIVWEAPINSENQEPTYDGVQVRQNIILHRCGSGLILALCKSSDNIHRAHVVRPVRSGLTIVGLVRSSNLMQLKVRILPVYSSHVFVMGLRRHNRRTYAGFHGHMPSAIYVHDY